jgi:iron complex transport system substrate-binding protein
VTAWRLIVVLLALAAAAAQARLTVTDDAGVAISLPAPARRIVSLSPHLTEQLFAIGAGDAIVGTTEFADHPPAARSIARVARAASVDLERIAALQPDLIVLWGSGFAPSVAEALQRLGIPVFISEPRALADIASSMRRLGVLTGQPAETASAEFSAALETLARTYRGRSPVRVFYQVWDAPLMTLSGRHVISEAIALCGGKNVFADLLPIAPQVATEAVIAADPELIATAEPGGRPSAALAAWSRFPRLAAVRRGQLVTLDADRINRHGPRMPQEIGALCEAIDSARRTR